MEYPEKEEKNLQLERLLFFSDAVIAIAITLLALDIRIEKTESGHLHWADLLSQWKTVVAFLLSFFNIASFWKTNNQFFIYIKQIDDRLLGYIIFWLLFIVLLPFSTSLVSNYFSDVAAMATYSFNILIIAIFQNATWDYASDHNFTNQVPKEVESRGRFLCNMDMINSLVGLGLSFISPLVAFIILFTKLPVYIVAGIWYRKQIRLRKMVVNKRENNKDGSLKNQS